MLQWQHEYWRPRDYELQGTIRKTHVVPCIITISEDDDDSAAVDLRGYGLVGLIVPTIDAADLTFYMSETEAGTYRLLTDGAGAAVTMTTGAGALALDTTALAGLSAYRWVKIHTSEVQTADRTFNFILKG